MAHGVPMATTEQSCGSAGAFFVDVGISSTHRIARFWRLDDSPIEMPRAMAPVAATIHTNSSSLVLFDGGAQAADDSSEPSHARWQERQPSYSLDPNAVIAAFTSSQSNPTLPSNSENR